MSKRETRTAAVGLLVVTLLLAALAPWGPIENRSFDHLHPGVYWGFNAFLTALGLASLATVRRLWLGDRGAFRTASRLAAGYVLVYALDLLAVFPTSPDPMGALLLGIEVVDAGLALAIVAYCETRPRHDDHGSQNAEWFDA